MVGFRGLFAVPWMLCPWRVGAVACTVDVELFRYRYLCFIAVRDRADAAWWGSQTAGVRILIPAEAFKRYLFYKVYTSPARG